MARRNRHARRCVGLPESVYTVASLIILLPLERPPRSIRPIDQFPNPYGVNFGEGERWNIRRRVERFFNCETVRKYYCRWPASGGSIASTPIIGEIDIDYEYPGCVINRTFEKKHSYAGKNTISSKLVIVKGKGCL